MSERAEFGFINLRGATTDPEFVAAVSVILGQALPVDANTLSTGNHRVYWLGPDEWLIVTSSDITVDLIKQLGALQGHHHMAVSDVSGGNILLRLGGKNVRDVLAKGSTLDFHADVFPIGHCAQSGLAKASVLIGHIGGEVVYELVVRRSFAAYLGQWLRSAAAEFGEDISIR